MSKRKPSKKCRKTKHNFFGIIKTQNVVCFKFWKEVRALSKVRILSLLSRQADLDALALSEQVGCAQPAASMALLRLVRQGLLNRAWDPQERRFFYSFKLFWRK